MGYYTQYKLKVIDGDSDLIRQFREENDHANYALDDYGDYREEAKWYDSDDDMKNFTKEHPETLFCMEGKGEESGDIWRQWWKNGKMQYCPAQLVYEEFNVSKMKEV